ncbi:MAG: right-handed parallel beta-helix repeat-containing protein [Thermoplasmatales archaeon]|nr:MAG: right-handed parallel beta-helix repeat-containing protein [Thermoplasmatales archaeon]
MKKKIIGIIICTLLITSAAVPITGQFLKNIIYEPITNRGTVYVDDDQDPSWYDATHVKTIQEGIINASIGDMVFVYNGIYNENVIVDKTVDLVGEDEYNTIIHGIDESDNAVKISADWCNFSEFTVENGGSNSGGIRVNANHCSIFDSIFDDNIDRGIFIEMSDYTQISNNLFSENIQGIYNYMSDYTIITLNDISSNKDNGILCLSSVNIDINSNSIESNLGVGIYLNNGCDYNDIINNTVSSNEEDGIRLYQSDENTVTENIVNNNGEPGEDGGIVCFYSHNNDIFENTVYSNSEQGIFIEESQSNEIFENVIYNNDVYGINCDSSNNNVIYNNNIYDNTQNGNDDTSNTWHNSMLEQGNYWDDYTGADNNYDGIGDSPYEIPGGDNEDEYPLMTPYGPPKADFTYSVDDKNVTFDASRSYDYDGTITTYNWNFGDGNSGSGSPVEHTYSGDGSYDVTLEVIDDDGKDDSTIKTVLVDSTPPEVIDNTPDTATTGDIFTFNATVTDNVEVNTVTTNYRYNDGDTKSVDMINTEGDYWEGSIIIEHTLDLLYYSIYAEDTFGNGYCSELWNVTIIDNDPAEITDLTVDPEVQMSGYYVNISAIVIDNIGLSEVNLHVEYPDSTEQIFPIIDNKIGDKYYSNETYIPDGEYSFYILAKDTSGIENVSETKSFEIVIGSPPEKPQINGPTTGGTDTPIEFEFKSKDGDGHEVFYYIDWGDGSYEEWLGPFSSDTWQSASHTWAERGEYTVKIKAKDITGLESGWSEHPINIPRNRDSIEKIQISTSSETVVVRVPRVVI